MVTLLPWISRRLKKEEKFTKAKNVNSLFWSNYRLFFQHSFVKSELLYIIYPFNNSVGCDNNPKVTFGYILYAMYRKKSIEIPKGYFFRVIPSTQFSERWMGNPGFWVKGVTHGLLFSAQAIFLLPHRDD